MTRALAAWMMWTVLFLCACTASVQRLPLQRKGTSTLVMRPAGYQPVTLSPHEFKESMRMLFAHGPLPGAPRQGSSEFLLLSADPWQLQKAVGYLEFCGQRDCMEVLTPSGGLDESGAREVALRLASSEAIRDASTAIQSLTPDQVRAILGVALVGTIIGLLSPDPVSKYLFIVTTANLIAFLGVDLFKSVVRGYAAMAEELAAAREFAAVRAAGERYGRRLGPTVARIVVMVATYGVAKLAGLFPGSATSLPGGSRAAVLAEAQGFRIPAVESARSVSLAADDSLAINLGTATAMVSEGRPAAPGESQAGPAVLVKEDKWDFFFGRVRSSPHNQARSLQNEKDLAKLGVREAEGGKEKLLRIFEEGLHAEVVSTSVGPYGTTVVRSVPMPGGRIEISYLYRPGTEVPEVTTLIPKIFQ